MNIIRNVGNQEAMNMTRDIGRQQTKEVVRDIKNQVREALGTLWSKDTMDISMVVGQGYYENL